MIFNDKKGIEKEKTEYDLCKKNHLSMIEYKIKLLSLYTDTLNRTIIWLR